jgi:hypothetical protein
VIERAVEAGVRRRNWSDVGVGVSVVLAVPLAMIVEWLAAVMIENSAKGADFAVLSLFAVPLVTAWAAIALSLSAKPVGIRLAVAALLLLAPPLLLLATSNA